MLRALILTAFICVYCHMHPSAAAATTQINSIDTTAATETNVSPLEFTDSSSSEVSDSHNKQQEHYYHPAEPKMPHVIEEYSSQFRDGSYEYKYILSNGVSRYEKCYWKRSAKGKKLLARKGFYSHPLPNHKYITVFYTADEHGFQHDTTKYTISVPTLPKRLDVPQLEFPHEAKTIITTTTTHKPTTTTKITTRKPNDTTTERPIVSSEFNWIY